MVYHRDEKNIDYNCQVAHQMVYRTKGDSSLAGRKFGDIDSHEPLALSTSQIHKVTVGKDVTNISIDSLSMIYKFGN